MFFPTSPSPPRGITRNESVIRAWSLGGDQEAEALEAAPNLRDLILGPLHERQAVPSHLVAEQAQGDFERGWVRLHLQEVVGRLQRSIDLACPLQVAVRRRSDLLRHLRSYHVRVHADPAD